jgi:hypothetical protein
MMLARPILALALGLALAIAPPVAAVAQTPAAYRPGLGDLMTMTVQPRHLKLALAGREKNWAYAAYEWHELEEALEHIAKLVPKWRDLDIGQLMAATVKQPLDEVEAAIKASDGQRFDAAFRQLTDACNACHKSANLAVIVIKVPDISAFPNQDFRATKP